MQSQEESKSESNPPNSSSEDSKTFSLSAVLSKQADYSLEGLTSSNFYDKDSKSWDEISPESKSGLIKQLSASGFHKATGFQAQVLPILSQKERLCLIAQGRNGCGKTLSYVIPCLEKVDTSIMIAKEKTSTPQILILTINSLLSRQIKSTFDILRTVYEAVVVSDNETPGHVMIGTPGEINRLHDKGLIDFANLKFLVLDEADALLSEDDHSGRVNILITKKFPESISLGVFSSYYQMGTVDKIHEYYKFLKFESIQELKLKNEDLISPSTLFFTRRDDGDIEERAKFLQRLFIELRIKSQVLIFDNLKSSIQVVASGLIDNEFNVGKLPGNLRDEERNEVVDDFTSGKNQILITSNILARGFDYKDIDLVINMDVPKIQWDTENTPDCGTFLNRVGRGGRLGKRGVVINLYKNDEEAERLKGIGSFFGIEVNDVEMLKEEEFFELVKKKVSA